MLCEILTDNRNRTAGEVRKIFELNGGKLGETGCVAWMFDRKGLFIIAADKIDEDTLMEVALEAGADDVKRSGNSFEVTCDPSTYQSLCEVFEKKGIKSESSEVTRLPKNTVDLDVDSGRQMLRLMELLDDHDDVQGVAANFNIPDEAMAALGQ